jgi:hypothetical protein
MDDGGRWYAWRDGLKWAQQRRPCTHKGPPWAPENAPAGRRRSRRAAAAPGSGGWPPVADATQQALPWRGKGGLQVKRALLLLRSSRRSLAGTERF